MLRGTDSRFNQQERFNTSAWYVPVLFANNRYEDGDTEAGVPPRLIRKQAGRGGGGGSFKRGDKVEANFGGKGTW